MRTLDNKIEKIKSIDTNNIPFTFFLVTAVAELNTLYYSRYEVEDFDGILEAISKKSQLIQTNYNYKHVHEMCHKLYGYITKARVLETVGAEMPLLQLYNTVLKHVISADQLDDVGIINDLSKFSEWLEHIERIKEDIALQLDLAQPHFDENYYTGNIMQAKHKKVINKLNAALKKSGLDLSPFHHHPIKPKDLLNDFWIKSDNTTSKGLINFGVKIGIKKEREFAQRYKDGGFNYDVDEPNYSMYFTVSYKLKFLSSYNLGKDREKFIRDSIMSISAKTKGYDRHVNTVEEAVQILAEIISAINETNDQLLWENNNLADVIKDLDEF